MKKQNRKEKGITLIALVVTIVVLLILAGVSITLLKGEDGIISKAREARNKTDQANATEQVELAILSSYRESNGFDYDILNEELGKIPNLKYKKKEIGEDNKIEKLPIVVDVDGYTIVVDEQGRITNGWVKTDEGITNGKDVLQIGEYIDYKPSKETYTSEKGTYIEEETSTPPEVIEKGSGYSEKQEFDTSTYNGGWRVLGTDSNTNELLVISEEVVKTKNEQDYYLRGYSGMTYGEEELNSICEIYGRGEGATGARSVKVEDINKITGYNPNKTGTGEAFVNETDPFLQYGNHVKYFWGESYKYKSIATNGLEHEGYLNSYESNGFTYADTSKKVWDWKNIKFSNGKEICYTTNTYYFYYPYSLSTDKTLLGEQKGISTTSIEFELLFKSKYWLASPYTITWRGNIWYGMRVVSPGDEQQGLVNISNALVNSESGILSSGRGLRPVVSLKEDIQITGGKGQKDNPYTFH